MVVFTIESIVTGLLDLYVNSSKSSLDLVFFEVRGHYLRELAMHVSESVLHLC